MEKKPGKAEHVFRKMMDLTSEELEKSTSPDIIERWLKARVRFATVISQEGRNEETLLLLNEALEQPGVEKTMTD